MAKNNKIYKNEEIDGTHLYPAEEKDHYYGTVGDDETNKPKGAGIFVEMDEDDFVDQYHKERGETVLSDEEYSELNDPGVSWGDLIAGVGIGAFLVFVPKIYGWAKDKFLTWNGQRQESLNNKDEDEVIVTETVDDDFNPDAPNELIIDDPFQEPVFVLSQKRMDLIAKETVRSGFNYYLGQYILSHSILEEELDKIQSNPDIRQQITTEIVTESNLLLTNTLNQIPTIGPQEKEALLVKYQITEDEILSILDEE